MVNRLNAPQLPSEIPLGRLDQNIPARTLTRKTHGPDMPGRAGIQEADDTSETGAVTAISPSGDGQTSELPNPLDQPMAYHPPLLDAG